MKDNTEKAIREAAEKYANGAVPNPSKYDAPFYTTLDRHEDAVDSFVAGAKFGSELTNKSEKEEEGPPTREYLIGLGFRDLPHFTVTHSLIYDLGRRRHLSIGDLGTPNEMVFINDCDLHNPKKITDLVCLHNWDYDGFLTKQKIRLLLEALAPTPPKG